MSFGNFGGRNRESIRILAHMQNIGVFNELPNDTIRFIQENYRTDVPYHNHVHVLYGLLWLHHKGAPLLAKLDWSGHDAGHNGIKDESPEVYSAFLNWQWLKKYTEWLVKRNIDPQDGTIGIDSSRFPYRDRNNKNHWVQWVRWADTLRIASGDTAQYLVERKEISDLDRFCAYFFESSQLIRELAPPSTNFSSWFPNAQKWFFNELHKALSAHALCLRPEMDGLHSTDIPENLKRMEKLLSPLYETDFLNQCYNFLSNDVTYPEFTDFVAAQYLK